MSRRGKVIKNRWETPFMYVWVWFWTSLVYYIKHILKFLCSISMEKKKEGWNTWRLTHKTICQCCMEHIFPNHGKRSSLNSRRTPSWSQDGLWPLFSLLSVDINRSTIMKAEPAQTVMWWYLMDLGDSKAQTGSVHWACTTGIKQ